MSVKNFDKKPLTIEWEIIEKNATTWQTLRLIEDYTTYYGDVTPIPSPSCPWGSNWTSISVDPYPIPATVTESTMYTMVCNYVVPEYIITWRVIEKNSGTWETRTSSQNFTCLEWDATPVPSLPSVNPWDWNPWTSSSIDPYPQYVTSSATYTAAFTYTPSLIPTGFYGSYNIRDAQWVFGWDSSLMINYQNFVDTLSGAQMYYIYNKEGTGVWKIIQAKSLSGDILLYYLEYDITNWLIITEVGYWKIIGPSSPEYNFRNNGDQNFINQNYGWSLDTYVAYLFNGWIISTS